MLDLGVVRLVVRVLGRFLRQLVVGLLRVSLCVVLMRPLNVEITSKGAKVTRCRLNWVTYGDICWTWDPPPMLTMSGICVICIFNWELGFDWACMDCRC